MTRRMRVVRFMVIGATTIVVLLAGLWASGLVEEVIPTQATRTPALVMPVTLGSRDSQTGSFLVDDGAHYKVDLRLELKAGPRGYQTENYPLKGFVQIEDQTGRVRVSREIEQSLLGHEIGGNLFDFDANEVGGAGTKTVSLRLSVGPEFLEQYSNMTLLIRRQPRWPIVD